MQIESDASDEILTPERIDFARRLRKACRKVYQKRLKNKQVAAVMGDGLAFYQLVSQLPFKVARGLAQGGCWYPGQIISIPNSELLMLDDVGPRGLRRIRQGFPASGDALQQRMSVVDLMNLLTKTNDKVIQFELPTWSELKESGLLEILRK